MDTDEYDELPPALGVVLVEGRGSLPFALLHGEPLVACAAWAMGAAGIELVDFTVGWAELRATGRPLVLHDALCPATPVDFLVRAVEVARTTGRVVVGARPVTDTVKSVHDTRVEAGTDREQLAQLASPVVLPAAVVAALDRPPPTDDPTALLGSLAARLGSVPGEWLEWLEAPDSARRVADEEDVRVLQAVTEPRT